MPEVQRYDLRRMLEGLAFQADDDERRADHLRWRAEHLRKRLVRMHGELDARGIPDPEGHGDRLRAKCAGIGPDAPGVVE